MRNVALLLVLPPLLAGCGGGGGSSQPASGGSGSPDGSAAVDGKGGAVVSIDWPVRPDRFVPLAANTVVVTLSLNGAPTASQTLGRPSDGTPSSSASFTGLAPGKYALELAAYPDSYGGGVAQATGAASLRVVAGKTGTIEVSMSTTVASVSILPSIFDNGSKALVSVGAIDAAGSIVLLAAEEASEAVTWSVDPIVNSLGHSVPAVSLSNTTGMSTVLTGLHSGVTKVHASVSLGKATPFTATGSVTVNATDDGTGTVNVS